MRRDAPQALLDVGELEQLLLLLGLDPQRRGDEVAERARVVDVRRRELQLLGEVRDEPDDPREQALDVACQRLDLGRLRVRRRARPRRRRPGTARLAFRSTSRIRRRPWTSTRRVPSGTRISLCTAAAVPISYRSSQPGSSTSGLRTVTSASSRFDDTTSSISLIERSWPIAERRHRVGEDDRLLQRQERRARSARHAPGSPPCPARARRFGEREDDRQQAAVVARRSRPFTSTSGASGMRRSNGPSSISISW